LLLLGLLMDNLLPAKFLLPLKLLMQLVQGHLSGLASVLLASGGESFLAQAGLAGDLLSSLGGLVTKLILTDLVEAVVAGLSLSLLHHISDLL